MNEYIKAGGLKDLKCYLGYFLSDELHKRLINAIANQVNQNVIRQEEVKKLKLERKLE